jgi:eukaryotic translation initiation factor 2C
MPPKSKKGGGGRPAKKTANGRAWNDSSKQTLLTQISEYIPEDMCWRCSGYGHKLLECSDKKSAKYWAIGEGKFEDKRAVEKFFQDHRDSLIENKTFVPKQKPRAPAPSDKSINMGVLAKEMKNTPASGSPKKAVKQRTPIYTEGVGESIYVQDQTVADNPLAVPRNGVPDVATTLVGPEAKENELSIIANYVKVQEVPAKLHVYSLTFSRPSLDPQKPTARIELNRRREIKIIFDALMDVDAFGLNGNTQSWATDYKDLWCAKPLDSPYEDKQWDTEICTCKLLDGKSYDGVYATVNYMGVLADIAEKLKKGDIRQVSDHIRALNAHNARCIARNDNLADPAVTQLGAKKSYLNKAFTPMKGYGDQASVLRAVLGYYTSIRPGAYGPILNVNVATTAFIAPMRVSQLLSAVGDSQFDYAERMLRGARVRLIYKRQEFAETKEQEYSMNDELSRTKVFQQFGEVASLQTFHTVLENSNKTGRSVAPGDAGTTVLKYFKGKR